MPRANTDFYDVTFSPDDEDDCGKGWYAQTINADGSTAEESELLKTEQHAVAWARSKGGRRRIDK